MEITKEQRATLLDAQTFAVGAAACVCHERKETMFGWALEDLDFAGGVPKARFMLVLLADETHGVFRFANDAERPSIQAVIDLWTREAEGERVEQYIWAAARAAARAAAWDAARAAASDAARAARDAASDAAMAAAWDAARAAASDAARGAARAVARAVASDAAWAAAWAAARDVQINQLRNELRRVL